MLLSDNMTISRLTDLTSASVKSDRVLSPEVIYSSDDPGDDHTVETLNFMEIGTTVHKRNKITVKTRNYGTPAACRVSCTKVTINQKRLIAFHAAINFIQNHPPGTRLEGGKNPPPGTTIV